MLGDSGYANTPFLIIPYNEPTEAYKVVLSINTLKCFDQIYCK